MKFPKVNASTIFLDELYIAETEKTKLMNKVIENTEKLFVGVSDRLETKFKNQEDIKWETIVANLEKLQKFMRRSNSVLISKAKPIEFGRNTIKNEIKNLTRFAIMDYLTRNSLSTVCEMLMNEIAWNIPDSKTSLTCFATFRESKAALMSLELKPLIKWCESRISVSPQVIQPLAFGLHSSQFLVFLRDDPIKAIEYARRNLSCFISGNFEKLKNLSFVLAKKNNKGTKRSGDENNELVETFEKVHREYFNLPKTSMFSVLLQVGLTALKSKKCGSPTTDSKNCLACRPLFKQVTKDLPVAHETQTHLICRLTGEPMDENNPPLALPNGQIFSERGVRTLELPNRKIKCPVTNKEYRVNELRYVYIL
eukprot:maker-scaffold_31-snap-gene-3.73-mRNA-1 protein AED:0.01 eAED:0.02 QI:30/0.66/0.7/1/0.88/0.8/10/83/367